ncbi:hypothetical protein FS837_010857 [Tulasnella sp. UAMH 9824]|nr:hypothetical protein FS837_010857 [Tulasnella sp. UAMH 9824]
MDSSPLQAAGPPPSYPPQPAASGPPPNPVTSYDPLSTTNGSPYNSWITSTRKDVKSNDKILNQDPQALQQFLLTHASGRPTVLIVCKGTHEVEGTDSDGAKTTTIVTDFHFTVDVSSALLAPDAYGAPVWVVADEEPAKRGRYWRQIDYDPNPPQTPANLEARSLSLRRRSATPLEKKQGLEDVQRRRAMGLPPWACITAQTPDLTGARLLSPNDRRRFENAAFSTIEDFSDSDLEPPSITLADWTEEYCANWSPLKEFRFLRTVYGWDFRDVQRKIASSLAPCHSGDAKKEEVTVIVKGTKVIVQSGSPLWWLYGLGWLRWFLYLTLIYPLILWPIKRYILGRCWKVAGSSFAFVRYEHLRDSRPGETVAQFVARVPYAPPVQNLKATSRGISAIVGQHFTDWYFANAQTFCSAASGKNKTGTGQRTTIVI